MFPAIIGSDKLGMMLDSYSDLMEKIVYEDSFKDKYGKLIKLKHLNGIKRIGKTLILWFGICTTKRIWIEEVDFLPHLVQKLSTWYDSFVFLIDGYTVYEHGIYDNKMIEPIYNDIKLVNTIKNNLSPFSNITIHNLVGNTFREKIRRCQCVDLFITNAGGGQLVPHRFCKKPGILHSNSKHCVFHTGINNTTVKLVNKSLVNDVGNLFGKQVLVGLISYSIDVQVISNMVIDILKLNGSAN